MQATICLDGIEQEFEIKNQRPTVLNLKQLILQQTGIQCSQQNLYDYPEIPNPGPGLRLLADDHVFDEKTKKVSLVLTLGEVWSWAYFYYHYQRPDSQKTVHKITAHRFSTVAEVKLIISMIETGLQVADIKLSHKANGAPLNENLCIFLCGVRNGSNLHVSVGNVPPLSKL